MDLKVACISDTHCHDLAKLEFPVADILVHAGDATYRGSVKEVTEFAEKLGKLKDKYESIYFIPGNHDWLFELQPRLAREIMEEKGINVLINQSIDHRGFKIWGSPTCPPFGKWAFYKNDIERYELWNTIPDDTDIIITHGPAKFILDGVECINYMGYDIEHTGCAHLANRIIDLKPKLHVCGHIHEGHGSVKKDGTVYINAAIMNERYYPKNPVQLVTIFK